MIFRITGLIATKIGTKHHLVNRIQVCTNKCLRPFPREVITKKLNYSNKIFFKILLQNHWANCNQTCSKASFVEGDLSLFKWRATPFSKSENYEIAKLHWRNLKKFSSPALLSQFEPILAQSILGCGGFKFLQIKKIINNYKVDNVFFFLLLIHVMI